MITFFISLLFHAFERHTVRIQGDEGSSIRCFLTFTRTVAPLQIPAQSGQVSIVMKKEGKPRSAW